MKNLFVIFACILLLTTVGCEKSDDSLTNNETKVVVKVNNGSAVALSNITVYQIDANKYNSFGADPFFKDQQSVSDASGTANFIIDPIQFNTGGQRTYYFFIKYTISGTAKTKVFGSTLSQGETKTGILVMD